LTLTGSRPTVKEKVRHAPRVCRKQPHGLLAGFEWVRKNITGDIPLRLVPPHPREGSAFGPCRATRRSSLRRWPPACRFFCRLFRFTPASDIMEELAKRLPKMGGRPCSRPRMRIAAISGPSSGRRLAACGAMTATSGARLFADCRRCWAWRPMAEVPLVVGRCPARRSPAPACRPRMEQSDLNIALYGGPRRPRRASSWRRRARWRDCFYQTMHAFNLAETYQMPVILLSDQSAFPPH